MSLEYRALTVGPISTDCYVLWDTDTRKAAIIDPGGDRDAIVKIAASNNLDVEWILLTHGHFDHCFYAGDLTEYYQAKIGMHELDVPQLSENLEIAAMYYDLSEYIAFAPTDLLNGSTSIMLGDSQIDIIHTPGHSPGGLCFLTSLGVFCGDTIFASSIGRTDFPGGSYSQIMDSIHNRILTLGDATRLYPGHGPATTVGAERRSNPFLQ